MRILREHTKTLAALVEDYNNGGPLPMLTTVVVLRQITWSLFVISGRPGGGWCVKYISLALAAMVDCVDLSQRQEFKFKAGSLYRGLLERTAYLDETPPGGESD